jgi:S1-C subfamily serine protease
MLGRSPALCSLFAAALRRGTCAFALFGLLGVSAPAWAQTFGDRAPATEGGSNGLAALRERADALDAMLAGDVCADPTAAAALLGERTTNGRGRAGAGATPRTSLFGAEDSANSSLVPPRDTPIAPEQLDPATSGGPVAQPLRRQDLVARVHQAVVLVISDDATGSGFFIRPDVVMTNNHVVADQRNGMVVVVGKGLSQPMKARVIAHTPGSAADDERDYAILKVDGANVANPLPLSNKVSELSSVVAAGYPGLLLQNDSAFSSLLRGDTTAMPELVFTQGTVMALQNKSQGLPVIAHTAPISGGNSGGPLIDSCGRVVGINSFIAIDVEQASNAGFALPSSDMLDFLGRYGVAATLDSRECNS